MEIPDKKVKNLKWSTILYRGIPMSKMRKIILEIFKKTDENNELEY